MLMVFLIFVSKLIPVLICYGIGLWLIRKVKPSKLSMAGGFLIAAIVATVTFVYIASCQSSDEISPTFALFVMPTVLGAAIGILTVSIIAIRKL